MLTLISKLVTYPPAWDMYGWVIVIAISIYMLINFILVFYFIFFTLKLITTKYYRIIAHKLYQMLKMIKKP